MAIEKVTIQFSFDYDPEDNYGLPASNFLYHFLNSFSREEWPITSITYNGTTKDIETDEDLKNLPIRLGPVDNLE
jgi:hypothetical protein